MNKALFFVAGIAVGLCTSLVAAQGAGSIAVLNTSSVYIGRSGHSRRGRGGSFESGWTRISSSGQGLLVTGPHPSRYSQ